MATPLPQAPVAAGGGEDEDFQKFYDSVEVALASTDVDKLVSVSIPHQSMLLYVVAPRPS
jgi:hypothetical protein